MLRFSARRRRSVEAMPIGGMVTGTSGWEPGPKSGSFAGSTSSRPGRLTTTIVARRAMRAGSRQKGKSVRLSAPIRKKSSSSGWPRRMVSSVSTL